MEPKELINTKSGPERIQQDLVVAKLRRQGWVVRETHGNAYQNGFPDIYAAHTSYGARWIEMKVKDKYAFTPAQLKFFPELASVGVGVWILTDDSDAEFRKLHFPANYHTYLSVFK